jgi:cytochrome c oxidase cbb3-type subunit 2
MVQIYEQSDPNVYITSTGPRKKNLEFVNHLHRGKSLLAFKETDTIRIYAPEELKDYVTGVNDKQLKLTTRLLLLRSVSSENTEKRRKELQQEWEAANSNWKADGILRPDYKVYELYEHKGDEAFSLASTEGILEDWVDKNFIILDDKTRTDSGFIYIHNPLEYRVKFTTFSGIKSWTYDPAGEEIASLQQLTSPPFDFVSRQQLIAEGEHIYAIAGCWYCHTDQTRTLVQDVVLNGSDSYPAPPSSANEYIYQKVTFPGTKRNGPDISRVAVKRPSRDWHIGHFWAPKTASVGSIMPSFRYFFDYNPSGTSDTQPGVPNRQFEAVYQYLMTKGTRITPPTQAWWLGRDPVQTIEIIEGRKQL